MPASISSRARGETRSSTAEVVDLAVDALVGLAEQAGDEHRLVVVVAVAVVGDRQRHRVQTHRLLEQHLALDRVERVMIV